VPEMARCATCRKSGAGGSARKDDLDLYHLPLPDGSSTIALQGRNQRAADTSARGTATLNQVCKGSFNALKVSQLCTHINQLVLRLLARFIAMRSIFQLEQLGNLVQAKTQSLCRLDETDATQISRTVAAHAALGPSGLVHQAFALVKTYGFHIDLRLGGQRANSLYSQVLKRGIHGP
jgi:hypothetical protein